MNYTHLTREQRYQIHALRRQDLSCTRIGAEVGCHASTVSRELKRNAGKRGYRPAAAHDKARARVKPCDATPERSAPRNGHTSRTT